MGMPRCHWEDLPADVRGAVEVRVGSVISADSASVGSVSDLAATVRTDAGSFFCKAIRVNDPRARMHRNEIRVNEWLPRLAPRLLWSVEEAGWLLLCFEHVAGRHPNFGPNSVDLAAIAETFMFLAEALTPCPVPVQPFSKRWEGLIAPELVAGDTLLHTDVTPHNFLVTASGTRVVDWAMPCRGAAWIDAAFLVVRLVAAGHTPAEAETWAEQLGAWRGASSRAVDAFADALVTLWRRKEQVEPAPHRPLLRHAAEQWSRYRRLSAS
jgi:hypothetical protein